MPTVDRKKHPWCLRNYTKRKCATAGCDKGALVGNEFCFNCSGAAIAQDNMAYCKERVVNGKRL